MPEPRPSRPYVVEIRPTPPGTPTLRLVLAKTDRGAKSHVIDDAITCRPATALEAHRLGREGVELEVAGEAADLGDDADDAEELPRHDPAGDAPGAP